MMDNDEFIIPNSQTAYHTVVSKLLETFVVKFTQILEMNGDILLEAV